MKASCLKCARHQQIIGYRTAKDAINTLWGVLINNMSADLELSDAQTKGLMDISAELDRVLRGAEEIGLDPSEYAEYIVGKADECTQRLKEMVNSHEKRV